MCEGGRDGGFGGGGGRHPYNSQASDFVYVSSWTVVLLLVRKHMASGYGTVMLGSIVQCGDECRYHRSRALGVLLIICTKKLLFFLFSFVRENI